MFDRPSSRQLALIRQFLRDITDPEKYAFAIKDQEVIRRALELLTLFE